MLSTEDVLAYMEDCGAESAYGLLLLCGPDGFSGTYEEYENLLIELEVK